MPNADEKPEIIINTRSIGPAHIIRNIPIGKMTNRRSCHILQIGSVEAMVDKLEVKTQQRVVKKDKCSCVCVSELSLY